MKSADGLKTVAVSTHSRPKAAGPPLFRLDPKAKFQHTAARRRLVARRAVSGDDSLFQHTAARRRLDSFTHPKITFAGFNTQPPEGGWVAQSMKTKSLFSFNTQPPEGGWVRGNGTQRISGGFNTQPPEGGWVSWFVFKRQIVVSTHSRPKAAGIDGTDEAIQSEFQHTAARRRLESPVHVIKDEAKVSTHSRPKAAGGFEAARKSTEAVSTHSRPKAAGKHQPIN